MILLYSLSVTQPTVQSAGGDLWWLAIIVGVIFLIVVVIVIFCYLYRNRGGVYLCKYYKQQNFLFLQRQAYFVGFWVFHGHFFKSASFILAEERRKYMYLKKLIISRKSFNCPATFFSKNYSSLLLV